jgi:hypothetical protein
VVSNKSKAVLRKSDKASFNPKNFLAKVGGGKTVLKCEKDEIVFLQGDVADAIFHIQTGKIKLTVVVRWRRPLTTVHYSANTVPLIQMPACG